MQYAIQPIKYPEPYKRVLKGLSHEIDFENGDEN
jgi:hypothetical protein